MFLKIKQEFLAFIESFLRYLPTSGLGVRLRRWYMHCRLHEGARNIVLHHSVSINSYDNLNIGDDVSVNSGVVIDSSFGQISIGHRVHIGPNTVIRAADHNFDLLDQSIRSQGYKGGQIDIGDDVWIGANVTILKDVKIGDKTIIGAGSVVTNNIQTGVVAVGVPAREIKMRSHQTKDALCQS